jgi:NADPH-dependent 2,4-dienoyl-CoA reductase/sulfur reductase-like enzyme
LEKEREKKKGCLVGLFNPLFSHNAPFLASEEVYMAAKSLFVPLFIFPSWFFLFENPKKVLIIGGGPCGLRTAIEAQLCGAKVVVVEKRDRFSRNNVLHLWPYVIHDLKALGAKKFYGKFCAGSIDHISEYTDERHFYILTITLFNG